tara:strand:- start:55 stop:312 length:258 start_codon:yes stop_codon:yes gene_type:complete
MNNINYKTIEERKKEVNEIIESLNNLELTIKYEPIMKLFVQLKLFIKEGNKIKISIPFPMIQRRIKGELLPGIREKSWIKLEIEK